MKKYEIEVTDMMAEMMDNLAENSGETLGLVIMHHMWLAGYLLTQTDIDAMNILFNSGLQDPEYAARWQDTLDAGDNIH